MATSAANALLPTAATVSTAAAVYTAAFLPTAANNSALPTVQGEVRPLPTSNVSGFAPSQVFFPLGNGLALSNGNVTVVASEAESPRVPEPIEASPNIKSSFSVPVSGTVNLLGGGTDSDRNVTFLMNQYN